MFQPSYHCSVGKANINKRKTEDDNDGDDDEDDEMKEIIKTKKSADEGSGYEDETDNTDVQYAQESLKMDTAWSETDDYDDDNEGAEADCCN